MRGPAPTANVHPTPCAVDAPASPVGGASRRARSLRPLPRWGKLKEGTRRKAPRRPQGALRPLLPPGED